MMPDIACGRLTESQLERNFSDAHPGLTRDQAALEAERCFYCHDAPCIEACPTGIDIPRFIKAIAVDNPGGAARIILDANILGGSCARVCPTEILCEQRCVHTAIESGRPVRIGALQRHATDWQMEQDDHPFTRGEPTGKRIAVVGAGPAGLACAHRLAMRGHEVVVFDSHERPGGLNQYGVAAYKLADDFAQREVDFLMAIGGIRFEAGCSLGRDITLASLRNAYDAVFLALGLGGVRALGLDNAQNPSVIDAVAFIEALRSAPYRQARVGRRVVVIGGGNTAIDAAVQARLLGAEEVTLVYRRGTESMSATPEERDWARVNDVTIRVWARPDRLLIENGTLRGVSFLRGRPGPDGAPLYDPEAGFVLEADMVLKAIGQSLLPLSPEGEMPRVQDGRIVVTQGGRTTLPGVYAGGDCTIGADLTVVAVRDGRDAAESIHAALAGAVRNNGQDPGGKGAGSHG